MAHLKLRAVRNSPPGHGIRMQTCSNLSWTSHNISEEGGRETAQAERGRPLGGRWGGGSGNEHYYSFDLSSCPRRRVNPLPVGRLGQDLDVQRLEWASWSNGIQRRSPGLLVSGPAGLVRSNRWVSRQSNDRCSPIDFKRHSRIKPSHNVTRADRSFESPAQNQQLAQPMVVFVF